MGAVTHPLIQRRYVSLSTFRRDGTPVATPVWLVAWEDGIAVWTGAGTGKVKRLRRNRSVTVAPCTFRGRLLGDPVPGQARRLTAEDNSRIMSLIIKKYRLQGWLTTMRARRRPGSTVSYAVTLAAGSTGGAGPAGPGGG
jgi:PPOX class probable F420-dependent enzyme